MKLITQVATIIATITCITLCVASCGKEGSKETEKETEEVADPLGTVLMNLTEDSHVSQAGWDSYVTWKAPNDLYGWRCGIVSLGKKKGLGDIKLKELPSDDLFVSDVAVEKGYAYLVKGSTGLYGYIEEQYRYMAIYIVDVIESTYGGIMGAKIKYCRYPFPE